MNECYLCLHHHPTLTRQVAYWVLEMMKVCPAHKEKIDLALKKEEPVDPKKYVLKPQDKKIGVTSTVVSPDQESINGQKETKEEQSFLPPLPKEIIKDYNEPREREANDGSLIE